MLTHLSIRNVAIIESVTCTLAPGFNVLTGETGAGKSIVVGALGLLLGARASAEDVRTGSEKAMVEGTFEVPVDHPVLALLDARGLSADEGQVVLRREVAISGRSRAWVNGTAVTTAVLAEIGALLVNIHGQHDARGLVEDEVQRAILDRFADAEEAAAAVAQAWDALEATLRAMAELSTRRDQATRRADYLRHVVRELGEARLVVGEDARLEEEARRLSHVEELRLHVAQMLATLDGEEGGALPALATVRRLLAAASRLDPSLDRLHGVVDEAIVQAEDASRELAHYEASLEADPARLAAVEQRRDLVYRLSQKYGGSIESALAALDEAQHELEVVETASLDLGALAQREQAERAALKAAAKHLTDRRTEAAARLGSSVGAVLPELGMPDGRFLVQLTPHDEPTRLGMERAEFLVALNPGHEPRALARVASGGELARVMLALTTVLARMHPVPTLVFDEIDAGIGGRVALQVGALMRRVANDHQVLAITHLAQIAARAHAQVVVTKAAEGGVTTANLKSVTGRERLREVARMLGGSESDASLRHAKELLQDAG